MFLLILLTHKKKTKEKEREWEEREGKALILQSTAVRSAQSYTQTPRTHHTHLPSVLTRGVMTHTHSLFYVIRADSRQPPGGSRPHRSPLTAAVQEVVICVRFVKKPGVLPLPFLKYFFFTLLFPSRFCPRDFTARLCFEGESIRC